MNKLVLIFCLLALSTTNIFAQELNPEALAYIEKYKQLAMDEQNRVGLPASITLAQGLYESANGTSYLAKEGNNHFGIKCKKDWKGETILHTDDLPNECFRKYPSAIESYLDHSNYLKNNRRYAFLFDIEATDFEAWAVGLKKAGYATNPQYAYKLTDIIKKYNLQQYTIAARRAKNIEAKGEEMKEKGITDAQIEQTKQKSIDNTTPDIKEFTTEKTKSIEEQRTIKKSEEDDLGYGIKNNLKGFYVKKGESLLEHATKRNIRYTKLLLINDLNDGPAPEDMFIYVEKKLKEGVRPYHVVREGETMIGIAQQEGMQLPILRKMNLLNNDEMPSVGETLNLIEVKSVKPKIVSIFSVQKEVAKEEAVQNEMPNDAPLKSEEENVADRLFVKNKNVETKELQIDKANKPKKEINAEDMAIETSNVIIDKTEPVVVEENLINNSDYKTENNSTSVIEKQSDEQSVIMPIPVQQPVLKSPSTYKEAGLSEEIRKLKQVMDKMVYAPPPPIKIKEQKPVETKPAKLTTKKVDSIAPKKVIAAPIKAKETPKKAEEKTKDTKVVADVPETKKPATTNSRLIAAPAKTKEKNKVVVEPVKQAPKVVETKPQINNKLIAAPIKKK